MKMVVKGISRKIFHGIALESCSIVHLGGGPMTVSEKLPSNSPRRVVQLFLSKLGMMFSRTKTFCFENDVFLTFGLGMCEGDSEDSRSGKG